MAAPEPADALPPAAVEIRGIRKSFGLTLVLRGVDTGVAEGRVLVLLGPSGCGKTTLLRIVAGLEVPDAGQVRVGGAVLTDGARVVPPERRRVGMVFQDWALFPHLSVAANVAFGLPRAERSSRRVDDALALVGLSGFGSRSPSTLSGGQQQRVALARALAPGPGVLLLDEPFSNLDATLRSQLRSEVRQLLADLAVTTVFVTHDQDEAFLLGDDVAVMRAGEVVQQASPPDLYARPASPWVARFVGEANLLPGTARSGAAETALGRVPLAGPAAPSGAVEVLVRPEHVQLAQGDGGVVDVVEFYGHDCVYRVRLDSGPGLRVRVAAVPAFHPGDRVAAAYAGPPTVAYATGDRAGAAETPQGDAAA